MANRTKILISDVVAARAVHECLDQECIEALKDAGLIYCVNGYPASVKAQLAVDLSILDEVRTMLEESLFASGPTASDVSVMLERLEAFTREEL